MTNRWRRMDLGLVRRWVAGHASTEDGLLLHHSPTQVAFQEAKLLADTRSSTLYAGKQGLWCRYQLLAVANGFADRSGAGRNTPARPVARRPARTCRRAHKAWKSLYLTWMPMAENLLQIKLSGTKLDKTTLMDVSWCLSSTPYYLPRNGGCAWTKHHGLLLTSADVSIIIAERPICQQHRPMLSPQYGTIPWEDGLLAGGLYWAPSKWERTLVHPCWSGYTLQAWVSCLACSAFVGNPEERLIKCLIYWKLSKNTVSHQGTRFIAKEIQQWPRAN